MKGCVKIRGNFHHILVVLPAAIVMLFVAAIILPAVSESTRAEGDVPEEGISIVASSDISVNLLSKDEGYYKIFKDSIKVSTSSENGYTLSIATDSADHQTLYLNGDTTSESKIDGTTGTYEEPKALGDYEWGFAVPGISHFDDTYSATDPSEDSKFAILPLENKIIRDYTEAATDHITDIYYGFKLSGTLEPGEYETSIIYTAVPADQPLVARAILGQNKNLNFVYDRKTYTVGETYTDNLGETKIGTVYSVPTESITNSAWAFAGHTSANFEPSFYNFRPKSTSNWFNLNMDLSTVTNAKNLNTSQVVSMKRMFYLAGLSSAWNPGWSMDLGSWDTSNVTDMSEMFFNTNGSGGSWTVGNLSGWDVGNVTNMSGMFYLAGRSAITWSIGDISGWKTSNVSNMSHMFDSAGGRDPTWTIGDLSGWNVSNVTDMSHMFQDSGGGTPTWTIGDLSGWNVSNVTNMSGMFSGTGCHNSIWTVGDLSGWNVSNVTNMSYMFKYAGNNAVAFDLNLGGWNVSNVTNITDLFTDAGKQAQTWRMNLRGWNLSSITNTSYMFKDAGKQASTWSLDLSGWKTGSVTDMSHMFEYAGSGASDWSFGSLDDWDVSKVVDMSYMFYGFGYGAGAWSLSVKNWDTSKVENMSHMFQLAGGSTQGAWAIDGIDKWNTSSATDMSWLFESAGLVATAWSVGDLSGWDVGNVVDMSYMFANAASWGPAYWSIGNVGRWNTEKVENMSHMFYKAGMLAEEVYIGDIRGWDVESVTDHESFGIAAADQPHWNDA